MNQLIKIGNQEITTKEYRGQKVVTFKDIDLVHERPEGTARHRFAENRERFVVERDYFVVNPQTLENTELDGKRPIGIEAVSPRGTAFLTERGYLMLVKSFTDDLAWEVQGQLVDGYFRVKEVAVSLSPELQLFKTLFDAMATQEIETKQAKELSEKALTKVENIKEAIIATYDNWREEINSQVRRISQNSGTSYQGLFTDMYVSLENRSHCDLDSRVRNKKARLIESGATKTTIKEETTKIAIIEGEPRLREIFTQIVKEYAVKYLD